MKRADREQAVFFHTYKRLPLDIERGRGMFLIDGNGHRYLDMFSGLAVNALGYSNPAVVKAVRTQAARYLHLSNYYLQEPQIKLAEMLADQTGYRRVFFCNSGTEAVEGAIKIARRWGNLRGKTQIVSLSNAFHGRTLGALSLMDRPRYREGFGPFLKHFRVARFNDPGSLRREVGRKTAAVIVEFIQGEGGVRPLSSAMLATLRELHARYGFLLIADEIQSGVGRTGKFFAFEHFGVHPDLVLIAKPIGGGLPLGAILGGPTVENILEPGMHGTTFGGNPVACAAGIAVLSQIKSHSLMKNAEQMGVLLKEQLVQLQHRHPTLIREVRGFGLMAGIDLTIPGDPIVATMRERKILINCTDTTVLRFLPPLIVKRSHILHTIAVLDHVLSATTRQQVHH